MSWKFWQKTPDTGAPAKAEKLPKPKEIHAALGRSLVVDFGKDPDWVWSLKFVERPGQGNKNLRDVRIFNEHQARAMKVSVRDYNALDDHPELILYEGWFDKSNAKAGLKEGGAVQKAPRAA